MKCLKATLRALTVAASLSVVASSALAEGSFATGAEWRASSQSERLAYLLGVANLMSADYELQRSGGQARGSAIPRLYEATRNISLEQAAAAIDAWYAANPERLNEDVLSVIWLTLVER